MIFCAMLLILDLKHELVTMATLRSNTKAQEHPVYQDDEGRVIVCLGLVPRSFAGGLLVPRLAHVEPAPLA